MIAMNKGSEALKNVVAFVAHPDDAEIGLGGTIARLVEQGVSVTVVTFTTSESSDALRVRRRQAAEESAKLLGNRLIWAENGEFDQVEQIPEYQLVRMIDKYESELEPDLIFTHAPIDSHVDHVRLSRAVVASSRRWRAPLYAFGPCEYRTPVHCAFSPNVFVDITHVMEQKQAALRKYSYNGQGFRELSVENYTAIARYYGAVAGYQYAEGFSLIMQRGLGVEFQ